MAPGLERRRVRAKKEKVADRPHWLTLLIGVIGPTATLAAVAVTGYFAYQSWQTAAQGMKVAQRAYVSIDNSQSVQTFVTARQDNPGGEPIESLVATIEQTFVIKNLGRTPASLLGASVRFRTPKGWWIGADSRERYKQDGRFWVYTLPVGGDVAQDNSRPIRHVYNFSLSDAAVMAYLGYFKLRMFVNVDDFVTFSDGYPIQVDATLKYRDVFGDEYSVTWQDAARMIRRVDVLPQ